MEPLCFQGRDPPQQFKWIVREVVEASLWWEEESGPAAGRVDSLSPQEEGLVSLGERQTPDPHLCTLNPALYIYSHGQTLFQESRNEFALNHFRYSATLTYEGKKTFSQQMQKRFSV